MTLVLSALIHAAVLWKWIPHIRLPFEVSERVDERVPLVVLLEPQQRVPPPLPPAMQQPHVRLTPSAPSRNATPQKPTARPPVPALERPDPIRTPALVDEHASYPATPPAPVPSRPVQPAPDGDLASYIESRRRAREAFTPATRPSVPAVPEKEDEHARANRIAAANLGVGRKPRFGEDTSKGGGIFAIQRLGYDYAEFLFYGWNKDIQRNTTQLIEVRTGNHIDIRRAVVSRMIVIIREHEQGDFLWESRRLGRNVTLSARPLDDAGLENFLMREFFDEPRQRPLSGAP